MSLPKLYLETTIPSYLRARRSRDLRLAAHQAVTEEWWETKRHEYDLYISDFVIDEAGDGDAEFASLRIASLAGIPSLDVNEEVDELATRLLAGGLIPAKAAQMPFTS